MEALDNDGKVVCTKKMQLWSGLGKNKASPGYSVSIETEDKYKCGEKPKLISVKFKVLDENGKPAQGIIVKCSFYETILWENVQYDKITDENGEVTVDYYIKDPGYVIIAGGVDYKYMQYMKRFSDIKIIEVTEEGIYADKV